VTLFRGAKNRLPLQPAPRAPVGQFTWIPGSPAGGHAAKVFLLNKESKGKS